MKSPGDIAQKLKQSQFRHSKKEIERLLSRSPGNCVFQRKIDVPGLGLLGFCTCPEIGLKACDNALPHLNRAPDCPKFKLKMDEEAARESVKAFFKTSTPEEIIAKYPGVAALMWVLDDEVVQYQDPYLVGGFDIPLWASSQEGASQASAILESRSKSFKQMEEDYATVRQKNLELQNQVSALRQENTKLLSSRDELRTRNAILETCMAVHEHAADRRMAEKDVKRMGLVKSVLVSFSLFFASIFRKGS